MHVCVFPILKLGNVHINILFSLKYDAVVNSRKNINLREVKPRAGRVPAHSLSYHLS